MGIGDMGSGCAVDNFREIIRGWKRDHYFKHETVELRLGKRVCTLHFEGVLCRENEKRFIEHVGCSRGGNVTFLHGLKKRRLCFRSRAVDLIGKENIREDRSFLKLEIFGPVGVFHDDIGADDVGGHEVGGELDT